jgi:hypothetical protein
MSLFRELIHLKKYFDALVGLQQDLYQYELPLCVRSGLKEPVPLVRCNRLL